MTVGALPGEDWGVNGRGSAYEEYEICGDGFFVAAHCSQCLCDGGIWAGHSSPGCVRVYCLLVFLSIYENCRLRIAGMCLVSRVLCGFRLVRPGAA